jgi:hypothetical protein
MTNALPDRLMRKTGPERLAAGPPHSVARGFELAVVPMAPGGAPGGGR